MSKKSSPPKARTPARPTERRKVSRAQVSSREIIGNVPQVNVPARWRKHYRRLLDLRDRLARAKEVLGKEAFELGDALPRERADPATNTYDQDWALSILTSDQNAIYEINEALDRLCSGNYGKCELTGKPIPPERLESIPWARFTVEAERDLEKSGELAGSNRRLGQRQPLSSEAPSEGRDPPQTSDS